MTADTKLRGTNGAASRRRWQRGRDGEGARRVPDTIFNNYNKLPEAAEPNPGAAIRGRARHNKQLHDQLAFIHMSNTSHSLGRPLRRSSRGTVLSSTA